MIRILFSVLFIFALVGCSSNQIKNDFKFNGENEKGVMIGSITFDGKYSAYKIGYRKSDNRRLNFVQAGKAMLLLPITPETEIEKYGEKGNVFGVELEPGVYIFEMWQIDSGSISTGAPIIDKIEVVIKGGEALYVGNFHFEETKSFGLTVVGAKVFYSSKYKRDSKLIKLKYPLIAGQINPTNIEGTHLIGRGEKSGISFLLEALGKSQNIKYNK